MTKVKFSMYDSEHEMKEDFGRNKRMHLPSLNPNLDNKIPLFERSDQLPSSASAVNAGSDFLVRGFEADDVSIKIQEPALRYQLAAGNFRGARLIDNHTYVYNHKSQSMFGNTKRFLVDEDHFQNVLNESRYGFREVSGASSMVTRTQQASTAGASQHTRWRGLEEATNPTIYPELPQSIGMEHVEANKPNEDVFRFNDVTLDQITTFPSTGF